MNPDKLFDYLDGKLSPADRTALEEMLMSDAQLRQQFNVAREIHRGGGVSREVIVPSEDPAMVERRGRLVRRIITAAFVLIGLNVVIGLGIIGARNNKQKQFKAKEAEIRQQLTSSLDAAAQNALPPPSFTADEIQITAPAAQWETVAARIAAAAETCTGSAAKGLPEDTALIVMVDIPSSREAEFRQILTNAGLLHPSATAGGDSRTEPRGLNDRIIVQVRIADAAR